MTRAFLSLEIVGEMLGFNGDKAIWEYLGWRWADEFPNFSLCKTFARQSKKLHWVKDIILDVLFPVTRGLVAVDSMPLPIAKWSRVRNSKMLRSQADWGTTLPQRRAVMGSKGHAVRAAGWYHWQVHGHPGERA